MKIFNKIKKWFKSKGTRNYYLTVPEIRYISNKGGQLKPTDYKKIDLLEKTLQEITTSLGKKYSEFILIHPFYSWRGVKVDEEDRDVEKVILAIPRKLSLSPEEVVEMIEKSGFKVGKIKKITDKI